MEKRIFKTEGEEYLADFFKRYKIQYQHQKRIDGLKGDKANFRTADFFLPGLNVYVEYNGQYYLPHHQERYKEKQRIYRENNIPCVFIFPENLGVLEFVFDKRLIAVLKTFHLRRELKKYRIFEVSSVMESSNGNFINGCLSIFALHGSAGL